MSYLLLIIFPLAMAGGAFALRRDTRLTGWFGVAAIVVELWLALSVPLDLPAQVLEITVGYDQFDRLFLATLCLSSLFVAGSFLVTPPGEYWIATLLLLLGASAAMLVIQEPLVVVTLLLLAGLLGGMQLVDQPVGSALLLRPQTLAMAIKYMVLVALGGLFLLIAFVLATAFERQLAGSSVALMRVIFGLLLIGAAVRLGLIPFHLWVPDVVEETPPPTMFVHAGLLTMLALPVVLVALQTQPQLLIGNVSGRWLLIGLGSFSTLLGGVVALLTSEQRRALAFLLIANVGLLAIGLGIGTIAGVSAALLGALHHVVATALIAVAVTLLERPVPGRREQAGALRERPVAALSLLLGVLVLLGAPPFSGWTARLMLIAAAGESWLTLAPTFGGLALMGLSAARLLQRALLRPPETPSVRGLLSDDLARLQVVELSYAPPLLLGALLAVGAGLLLAGLWPYPIMAQVDVTVRSFSFLRQ